MTFFNKIFISFSLVLIAAVPLRAHIPADDIETLKNQLRRSIMKECLSDAKEAISEILKNYAPKDLETGVLEDMILFSRLMQGSLGKEIHGILGQRYATEIDAAFKSGRLKDIKFYEEQRKRAHKAWLAYCRAGDYDEMGKYQKKEKYWGSLIYKGKIRMSKGIDQDALSKMLTNFLQENRMGEAVDKVLDILDQCASSPSAFSTDLLMLMDDSLSRSDFQSFSESEKDRVKHFHRFLSVHYKRAFIALVTREEEKDEDYYEKILRLAEKAEKIFEATGELEQADSMRCFVKFFVPPQPKL